MEDNRKIQINSRIYKFTVKIYKYVGKVRYSDGEKRIIYLVWPGNSSGSPRRNWRVWLGRRKPGGPCLASCHRDPAPDKRTRMDGWMDEFVLKIAKELCEFCKQ